MTYSEVVALRVRQLCKERNITISTLALSAGLRVSTIDSIMKGKSTNPQMRSIHRIAFAFSMTLSEFFDFDSINDADPSDFSAPEELEEVLP